VHRAMIEQMKLDCTGPLSFCISLLKNPNAPLEEKKWAVAQMFPYSHPKLASVESRTGGQTHEARLEELLRLCEDD
jgi:hypothetical protein